MTVILVEKSELDGIAKYVATRIFELVLHATQSHQNEQVHISESTWTFIADRNLLSQNVISHCQSAKLFSEMIESCQLQIYI